MDRFWYRLRDWRFWAVQALVVLVTGVDLALSALGVFAGAKASALAFVLASLYFIPVLYASLNFGREGALPTTLWSALLAIPTMVIWHRDLRAVSEAVQLLTMFVLAIIIADRVDRERGARRRAEVEESAHRASEAKYRSLFDRAGQAILVYDAEGIVQEANSAAGKLLSRPPGAIRGLRLIDLLGAEGARILGRAVDGQGRAGTGLPFPLMTGAEVWVEPTCAMLSDEAGNVMVQALLQDVTERREHQRGLESYTRQVLQAQEDERQRISREIHDGSLQAVVLLCRRLDVLEDAVASDSPRELSQALNDARQSTEAIAAELRRVSHDLRPSLLDDLGLIPAIKWLLNDLSGRTGIRGRLLARGVGQRLAPDAELCLFRIAQEALRNVEAHAHASRVVATLTGEGEQVRLLVEDDGLGFESEGPTPKLALSGKLGILGMQERARLLGGGFTLRSSPGKGTCIQVSMPVRRCSV